MFMKHLPLNAELFIQNRKRFVERMDKGSIAIFNSNDELPANGDAIHRFKQNADLVWLTGIERIRNTGRYWYWCGLTN
jgi:Xaa-Pro aminopeptidase